MNVCLLIQIEDHDFLAVQQREWSENHCPRLRRSRFSKSRATFKSNYQLTISKGKGDTTTYDRMIYIPVANNQAEYHTYGINWTSAAITWTLNGAPVRTLKYADAQGGSRFPQTPSRLKIGIWAAPTDKPGVVAWAGGLVDLAKAPYAMTVSEVNIVNYTPAKEYRYKDRSGNWDSIEAIPEDKTHPATEKPTNVSNEATMAPDMPMPISLENNPGGSSPPPPTSTPASTSVAKPGNSSSGAVSSSASASAHGTKSSNTTAQAAKSNSSSSASKPASANGATSQFGATSAAIAGLSLLFLAFFA